MYIESSTTPICYIFRGFLGISRLTNQNLFSWLYIQLTRNPMIQQSRHENDMYQSPFAGLLFKIYSEDDSPKDVNFFVPKMFHVVFSVAPRSVPQS